MDISISLCKYGQVLKPGFFLIIAVTLSFVCFYPETFDSGFEGNDGLSLLVMGLKRNGLWAVLGLLYFCR